MSMHYCQHGAVKPNVYVVRCKKCTRSIPAGTQEFPRGNLVVQCPLYGELRRYRESQRCIWAYLTDISNSNRCPSRGGGRAAGKERAVLLADAGRRAPDANSVRCDDATDRDVAPSGKLTMIARPVNRIAEEKGGGKSVREIDKEGS